MSRSVEEQQLLDKRIEAMKRKNEELRRRHLEVEADKMSAAKQNALVQIKSPYDDEWVPGGRHEREEGAAPKPDQQHQQQQQRGWRPNRVPSGGERSFGEDKQSRDYSGPPKENTRNRPRDWGSEKRQWQNQPLREEASPNIRESSKNFSSASTFSSKVFKNSSIEGDKGWKPKSRLSEGDGPPSDPVFSFLGDDARDSPEVVDRRQGFANRRGSPRGQGPSRGGRSWNNRRNVDSREYHDGDHRDKQYPRSGENYEAWRRERNKIDEDRINRQKTLDGWSREWDNNKVYQEDHERHSARRGNRGFRHGGRGANSGTPANTAGVAQARMTRMREGHFPGQPDFLNDDFHHQTPLPHHHEQIRRGRFGPRKSKSTPPSHDFKPEKQSPVTETPADKSECESSADTPGTSVEQSSEAFNGSLKSKSSNSIENTPDRTLLHRRRVKTKREKSSRVSRNTPVSSQSNDNDGSWEDLSSEENISEITEMVRVPKMECTATKSVDVSSGPESLDPIPSSGKEDGFLWDDYNTGGFQDNMTLEVNTEEVCKALLEKKGAEGNEGSGGSLPCPAFKLDTRCLDDSDDDGSCSKIDPLLVTTQIVQAEVEKMSLPSTHSDEAFFSVKSITIQENGSLKHHPTDICAEELSGPVSILQVPVPSQLVSSDSEVSFQFVESPDSPQKQLLDKEGKINSSHEITNESSSYPQPPIALKESIEKEILFSDKPIVEDNQENLVEKVFSAPKLEPLPSADEALTGNNVFSVTCTNTESEGFVNVEEAVNVISLISELKSDSNLTENLDKTNSVAAILEVKSPESEEFNAQSKSLSLSSASGASNVEENELSDDVSCQLPVTDSSASIKCVLQSDSAENIVVLATHSKTESDSLKECVDKTSNSLVIINELNSNASVQNIIVKAGEKSPEAVPNEHRFERNSTQPDTDCKISKAEDEVVKDGSSPSPRESVDENDDSRDTSHQ